MTTATDTTGIYNDFSGFSQLRADARNNSPEAIREVARQFEAVFVQMMLKSMRDASVPFESGLFSDNSTRTYTDMYDKQLGIEMTKLQGIGLADVIARQLTNPYQQVNEVTPVNTVNPVQQTAMTLPSLTAISRPVSVDGDFSVSGMTQSSGWSSPEDFVRDSWPHAVRAGEALNIDPRVLIAQSALETGWGSRVHTTANGENSYCLFGIKANQDWQGRSVDFQTLEFTNGAMQRQLATFRAYDSMAAAYDDYVNFLQSNPRYADVLRSSDSSAYSQGLQDAGYATDPNYADKIERIRNGDLINDTVSRLKLSTDVSLT